MSFPRFKHPSGQEFAVNPAFVSRVYNDDDRPENGQFLTRLRINDEVACNEYGWPVCPQPETVVVVGDFQTVLNKLNHAGRITAEVLQ